MDNSIEGLLTWAKTTIHNSTLNEFDKKYALNNLEYQIVFDACFRGNMSEWLVNKYGKDKFDAKDLYL
jgi:hypothetical protein